MSTNETKTRQEIIKPECKAVYSSCFVLGGTASSVSGCEHEGLGDAAIVRGAQELDVRQSWELRACCAPAGTPAFSLEESWVGQLGGLVG